MSFVDGWSAIHLEMPARVPHTEYSVERHWQVVKAVTGLDVDNNSSPEDKSRAGFALMKAWNFDFRWCTLLSTQAFGDFYTDMGHAEYETDGVDRRDRIYCPFKTPEEVLGFDFEATYGAVDIPAWIKNFNADYALRCRETPDQVNMTGIYATLISGLIFVFGWDMLLLAAGTDPNGFGEMLNRYAKWVKPFFNALAQSNAPVVMVHDDMVWTSGPIFSPKFYRRFIFPNLKQLIAPLREAGKKIMFTSDGDYTLFLDDLVDCGVNGVVMEPMTDMKLFAEKYGRTHVFIGNADTRILLSGSRDDIRAEVERCMQIGKSCPGFFMAVGNHIPHNTPVENVLYYMEVYQELSRR